MWRTPLLVRAGGASFGVALEARSWEGIQVKLRLAVVIAAIVACLGLGFAGVASASPVVGLGLDDSDACLDGTSCISAITFSLDPPGAKTTTGTIDLLGTTAVISLTVPSYTMTGSSGSVTGLVFSDVTYSATIPITTTDLGFGFLSITQDSGLTTGSVSGTYSQTGGPGAAPFGDATASYTNFNCFLDSGVGQCGFTVGGLQSLADFALDVDGVDHDVVQTFNVIVPEPGTFALVGLGLLGIATRRRR
jgi:hypothetical protein